jgi:hypothetical protein
MMTPFHPVRAFMRLALLCLPLLIVVAAWALPPPQLSWAKRAGGTGADYGTSVAVSPRQGVYNAGIFTGTATFGAGDPRATTFTANNGGDGYLQYVRPNGTFDWARQIKSSPLGNLAVAALEDGSATVAGTFTYAAYIKEDAVTPIYVLSHGSTDGFIAHYKANGEPEWIRALGGAGDDNITGICAFPDRSVAVVGTFSGSITLGTAPNTVTLTAVGASDIFLARYGSDGALLWAKRLGGDGVDTARAIACGQGKVAIAGGFSANATFGDSVEYILMDGWGGRDATEAWVRAGGDGAFLNANSLCGEYMDATLVSSGVALCPNGNIAVTGTISAVGCTYRFPSNWLHYTSAGGTDVFAVVFDPVTQRATNSGLTIFGGPDNDTAGSVVSLPDNSIQLVGTFSGTGTVRYGDGVTTDISVASTGGTDAFLCHLNTGMVVDWIRTIGGPSNDAGTAIAPLATGGAVLTGAFQGSMTIAQGEPNATTLTSAGSPAVMIPDILLVKGEPGMRIPMTAPAGERIGTACWEADGSGPEPKATGHTLPWLWSSRYPSNHYYAYYYVASREFIDAQSPGAVRGVATTPANFPFFAAALAANGYTLNELTMRYAPSSLNCDLSGSDWHFSGDVETRIYQALGMYSGMVTLYLRGEKLLSAPLDRMYSFIDYNQLKDATTDYPYTADDEISGLMSLQRLVDASQESAEGVRAVAQALLHDLGGTYGLRLYWDSIQSSINESFTGSGRYIGGYFFAPVSWFESVLLESKLGAFTRPLGGESWSAGSIQHISWTSTGDLGPTGDLKLIKAGNVVIERSVPMGQNGVGGCDFAIPSSAEAAATYQFMLFPAQGSAITSNAFSLTASTLQITDPTNATAWQAGSQVTVAWAYTGTVGDTLHLRIFNQGHVIYSTDVPSGEGATGSTSFMLPDDVGGPAEVILDNGDGLSAGQPVNITPCAFTVTAPNGGELWAVGTSHDITFTYTGAPDMATIELWRTDPATGVASRIATLAERVSLMPGGSGSWTWNIQPDAPPTNRLKVRVRHATRIDEPEPQAGADASNGEFSIVANRVNQPDFWVRLPNEPNYSGNNLYSLTDGLNQAKAQTIMRNGKAYYYLYLENDSLQPDTFTVSITGALPGWTVRAINAAGVDYPNILTTGTTIGPVQPGARVFIQIGVVPGAAVAGDAVCPLVISAVSQGNTQMVDKVALTTTMAATHRPDLWLRLPNEANYIGNNVFSLDGQGQSKASVGERATSQSFYLRLYNDGSQAETFTLRIPPPPPGWTVKVISGLNGTVTAAATSPNGAQIGPIAVDGSDFISLIATPQATLPANAAYPIQVSTMPGGMDQLRDVALCTARVYKRQADLWVRNANEPTYGGDNLISLTGLNQMRMQTTGGAAVQYQLRVQNDGELPDDIKVRLSAIPAGWTVRAFDGNNAEIVNITDGTARINAMAPGTTAFIYVTVTPNAGTPGGSVCDLTFTAGSATDLPQIDVVQLTTTKVDIHQPDFWLRNSTEGAYTGDNQYTAAGAVQARLQTVPQGTGAIYYLYLQNDGNNTEPINLKSTALPAGWTARVLAGGVDVTANVFSPTGATLGPIAPTAKVFVQVTLTATAATTVGESCSITLTAAAGGMMETATLTNTRSN